MLLDFDIVPDKRSQLAGAVHIDGTARIQTIFKQEQNPYLFDLLSLLSDKYHVRALINTSFNGKGEPIVHTSEDALKSAQQMGIDGLVLNGKFQQL